MQVSTNFKSEMHSPMTSGNANKNSIPYHAIHNDANYNSHVNDTLLCHIGTSSHSDGLLDQYSISAPLSPKLNLSLDSLLLSDPDNSRFTTELLTPTSNNEDYFIMTSADPVIDSEDLRMETEQIDKAKRILSLALKSSPRLAMYNPTRIVGYGTFGVVVEGHMISGKKVAVKIMLKETMNNCKIIIDPHTNEPCLMEIAMLKYLPKHENIIEYIAHWFDTNFWYLITDFYGCDWRFTKIILPHMDVIKYSNPQKWHDKSALDPVATRPNDRSLAGLLRACGGFSNIQYRSIDRSGPIIPEHAMKHIFLQIVHAVNELHSNGITHRDLKDENILVDENLNIHLIDFGHASFYGGEGKGFSSYGTTLFAAPELKSGFKSNGPEADIYAIGLMIYEAVFGDLPEGVCDVKYCANGHCVFIMDATTGFVNPLLIDLCRSMLCPDPTRRPSIEHVMNHPWFLKH